MLLPNDPDVGRLTTIWAIHKDLLLERVVVDYILEPSLMTEIGFEFLPGSQNVVLVWSVSPLGGERLVSGDLIEEGRGCKIE